MNRLLVDVNVILDVLLARVAHLAPSKAVLAAVESGRVQGRISAHAVTTIFYLLRKELGGPKALSVIASILTVFEVAPVDGSIIRNALLSGVPDFEDAVTAAAAAAARCDFIVTRDPDGFRKSTVRVLTPAAALPLLK